MLVLPGAMLSPASFCSLEDQTRGILEKGPIIVHWLGGQGWKEALGGYLEAPSLAPAPL